MSIFEPCAGDGAIAEPLRAVGAIVTTNDIVSHNGYKTDHQIDFLTGAIPGTFDKVISNPPYCLSKEFIEKSLTYAPEVWVILRTLFLEGVQRNALLRKHLAEVHVYTKRVEFSKGQNAMSFSWFKFVRSTTTSPTIHWL